MTTEIINRSETGSAVWDLDWLRTTKQAAASTRQVSMVLGIDPKSVTNAVARGEIPSVRIGKRILIPVMELRRMLGVEDGAA